jgi:hypothetical protein
MGGGPEFYQDVASVMIKGGSSSISRKYPDIFIANTYLDNNACKMWQGANGQNAIAIYPNPGPSIIFGAKMSTPSERIANMQIPSSGCPTSYLPAMKAVASGKSGNAIVTQIPDSTSVVNSTSTIAPSAATTAITSAPKESTVTTATASVTDNNPNTVRFPASSGCAAGAYQCRSKLSYSVCIAGGIWRKMPDLAVNGGWECVNGSLKIATTTQ